MEGRLVRQTHVFEQVSCQCSFTTYGWMFRLKRHQGASQSLERAPALKHVQKHECLENVVFRTYAGIWCAFRSALSIHSQGVKLQLLHAAISLFSFVFCLAMFVQQV